LFKGTKYNLSDLWFIYNDDVDWHFWNAYIKMLNRFKHCERYPKKWNSYAEWGKNIVLYCLTFSFLSGFEKIEKYDPILLIKIGICKNSWEHINKWLSSAKT